MTQKTAKPAVSFGGKYRIVDFPLSNCVNSDIDTVGIATQYQPQKLNEYIGNGQPWDLDRLHGGVHTLPPYEQANGTDWYKGTANAIYQNIGFIDSYDPEYVIILSGDQICKQDYADFLRFHKEKGAEFSVAVMEVDWKEASRFGLMVADENDRITEFQEKPPVPKSNLASMGIYIFNWDVLKKYLEEDEADPNSKNDFGMNIIPALLRDGQMCIRDRHGGGRGWRGRCAAAGSAGVPPEHRVQRGDPDAAAAVRAAALGEERPRYLQPARLGPDQRYQGCGGYEGQPSAAVHL